MHHASRRKLLWAGVLHLCIVSLTDVQQQCAQFACIWAFMIVTLLVCSSQAGHATFSRLEQS